MIHRDIYLLINNRDARLHTEETLKAFLDRRGRLGADMAFLTSIPGFDHASKGAPEAGFSVPSITGLLSDHQYVILHINGGVEPHLVPAHYEWEK